MNPLFPVFLKLEDLHTLIVGGGYVGMEKINAVLENSPGATVTLVAPEIREEITTLAQQYPLVKLVNRKFAAGDLEGKDIVIVATNDKNENARIKRLAKQRRLLCNVADTPALCDFYLSSVVKKNDLKMAISTNGLSPTVAKRIKQVLDEAFPEEIETAMQNLGEIRKYLAGDFSEKVAQLNSITELLVKSKKAE
jgi:siroheme synthase-like protein